MKIKMVENPNMTQQPSIWNSVSFSTVFIEGLSIPILIQDFLKNREDYISIETYRLGIFEYLKIDII